MSTNICRDTATSAICTPSLSKNQEFREDSVRLQGRFRLPLALERDLPLPKTPKGTILTSQ